MKVKVAFIFNASIIWLVATLLIVVPAREWMRGEWKIPKNISTCQVDIHQCWIHFQRFGNISDTIVAKKIVYIESVSVSGTWTGKLNKKYNKIQLTIHGKLRQCCVHFQHIGKMFHASITNCIVYSRHENSAKCLDKKIRPPPKHAK